MVAAIKRIFGATEMYVGSIEGVVAPVPGSDTPEGRARNAERSRQLLERAWAAANQQNRHNSG